MKILRIYLIYCALVVATYAYANRTGWVWFDSRGTEGVIFDMSGRGGYGVGGVYHK